jgi:hypothetical protein
MLGENKTNKNQGYESESVINRKRKNNGEKEWGIRKSN